MKRGALRQMFGMVLQDTWPARYGHHPREHRVRGRERREPEAEIVRPRRRHGQFHFIHTLPENYGTPINEEPSNLSQGRKQLLTI